MPKSRRTHPRVILGPLTEYLTAAFALWFALASVGYAASDPAEICEATARQISTETGVPIAALDALARSGSRDISETPLRPWPWTVNLAGRGIWFETEAQALGYVFRHFKSGVRQFEVGCFQINYARHSQAFRSIEEMFDPVANGRYAARALRELYDQHGGWSAAVEIYHARNTVQSDRTLPPNATIQKSGASSVAKRRRRLPQVTDGTNAPGSLTMSRSRSRLGSLVSDNRSPGPRLLTKRGG